MSTKACEGCCLDGMCGTQKAAESLATIISESGGPHITLHVVSCTDRKECGDEA